jgi:hypothetical protein
MVASRVVGLRPEAAAAEAAAIMTATAIMAAAMHTATAMHTAAAAPGLGFLGNDGKARH